MKEKVVDFIYKIQNARYFVKLICFAAVCFVCGILSLVFSGVTLAYEVEYSGQAVSLVSSRQDFKVAKILASEKIAGGNSSKYIKDADLKLVVTLKERINTPEYLCDKLLENTPALTRGVALTVNGVDVAFAKTREEMDAYIKTRLACYDCDDAENSAEFVDNVVVSDIYCTDKSYTSSDEVNGYLCTLSVKTTAKYREDIVVAYGTITQKTNEKLVGYREVTVDGVNGLNHSVEQVVYIDGVECERKKLDDEVVTAPVDKVVVVGTAYNTSDNNATTNMVFPIARTSYFISSPFKEYRGYYAHKGVDIATNKGTPIYAVQEGTVLTAGWHDDYGYHVIINHGNGVKTLYAHASKLCVSAGQEVKRGQKIAEVGSTGWSTGYHLHIELIINGKYVDALKYIGE
ncbi:MAG: peptidoglycan DD-metalloendopeptidase family protein [Clostridia bacterium]|nr:hypothetical protein [Oscillospiraceae bacterium]MBQ2746389.1 peptidoglycan DD-metalloendopeptidase family protein [Clostridia bacterium]